jgi:hypothetical protein
LNYYKTLKTRQQNGDQKIPSSKTIILKSL